MTLGVISTMRSTVLPHSAGSTFTQPFPTTKKAMGVSEDEVQALLDYGCDPDEIEELLYDPELLHEMTGELLYAY